MANPYEFDSTLLDVPKNQAVTKPKVYRQGGLLVVHDDRDLPKYCLWTNEPAYKIVEVEQRWQPIAVYFLLLLGILPYFLVSPFVNKKIKLRIPIGLKKYKVSLHVFLASLVLMFAGVATIIGYFAIAFTQSIPRDYFATSIIVVLIGFAASYLGLVIAASPIGRVSIVKIEKDCVTIKHVHIDYLNRLSSY
jgi:hypothetical protein